jgi:hypothetical protein
MSEPIIYVDQSEIRAGKLEPLKAAMEELAEFVENNEPQIVAYNVYFNRDDSRMTVVHVHNDPASLAFHMEVAGRMFPRFSEFIRMEAIDIYGRPGEDLVQQLRGKAEMLGSGAVRVHAFHAGVARFANDQS